MQSAYIQKKTARGAQSYLSLTHGRAALRGCVPNTFFSCLSIPDSWVSADYDQRWTATAGQSLPLRRGWITWNAAYGSGILSSQCSDCGAGAHLTFDVGGGLSLSSQTSVSVVIRNLLNDRYAITGVDELQGAHFSMPRSFEVNLSIGE